MLNYIIKRLIQMLGVLFLLSILTFLLSYFSPSDPIEQMSAGKGAIVDEAVKEELRERYGLNGSLPERYIRWLGNAFRGDLGDSIRYNTPVWKEMKPRIRRTALLAVTAFAFMLVIAVPLGILSALFKNRLLDYLIRFLSFLGSAFPGFWLGMLLLYWLGYRFRLVSVLGTGKPKDVFLPALTLAIPLAARYIRLIRTQMLEELGQEYVTASLSRGVSYPRIILCHILPNSFLGLLTMLGMSFGNLFGGTAVIEAIFNWQGVGYMAVNSVQDRDYNMIQGYALWMGLIFIGLNLLVDVLNLTLDPRRRLGSGENP